LKRFLAGFALLALGMSGLVLVSTPAAKAQPAPVLSFTFIRAVQSLPVAAETRSGYDRARFRLWTDADGDCRDTRDEVLAAESLVPVRGCDIRRGKWRSYYDGAVTRDSTSFDIDHLVPLAEAWDSGAKRWTPTTRERYANDLGDRRALVAVTASANRSKSDQDPAEWMPELGQCRYLRDWVAVKIRWSLTVDPVEKRSVLAAARTCGTGAITVRRASTSRSTTRPTSTPVGRPKPHSPSRTDPRFRFCYEAIAAGYGPYVRGRDPEYAWYTDSDGDGRVCE
jgi:hypothetical protein